MASADVISAPGLHIKNNYFAASTQENLKRTFQQFANEVNWAAPVDKALFKPSRHLVGEVPEFVHTMEDIGYPASKGVSPVAVSEPFRLFSEEAVMKIREEVLAPQVQDNYSWTSDIAPEQIRGFCPKYAKFTYEAWNHPETLAVISRIAGVDLVPVVDYEIGHTNISVPGSKKDHDKTQLIAKDDEKPVVDWHKDSYPFVCVLMMSDTTGMVGGETALKMGNGEIKKVRGPGKGCAVILQGRYIEHQALRAFGSQERITMVTSFRPRSPFIRDDTVLNTVRPISDLSDLYGQVMEYQLENMEARVRRMLKITRDSMKAGKTDVQAIKKFLEFEIQALQHIDNEIVEESKVKKGALAEMIAKERADNAAKAAKGAKAKTLEL